METETSSAGRSRSIPKLCKQERARPAGRPRCESRGSHVQRDYARCNDSMRARMQRVRCNVQCHRYRRAAGVTGTHVCTPARSAAAIRDRPTALARSGEIGCTAYVAVATPRICPYRGTTAVIVFWIRGSRFVRSVCTRA